MTLRCDSTIDPQSLPRLPVFGGGAQNTWVVAFKGTGRTPAQVQKLFDSIWQSWSALFPPGAVSVARTIPGVPSRTIEPADPPVTVAGTADVATLLFSLEGPDGTVRWPTWVRRRRERIDPLCPLQDVDATVTAIGQPERGLPPLPRLEQPPPPLEDPLDLGLGPVDPPGFPSVLSVGAIAVGAIALAVLLSRRVK